MSKDAWLNWYPDREIEEGVTRFARLLKEAGSSKVLDSGCGTGRNTIHLASLGFEVHGFDWSDASITEAKKGLALSGLSADLRVWDMNEIPLPYPDAYFDGVLVMRVMHHTYAREVGRIATEVSRITKSGGLLYAEVPAYERAHRPQACTEPEPGTYVPSTGDEAGIPHHFFRKEEPNSLFSEFVTLELEVKYDYHYCFTARRK